MSDLTAAEWALLGITTSILVPLLGWSIKLMFRSRSGARPHLVVKPLLYLGPGVHDRPRPYAFQEEIQNIGQESITPVFIWCTDPDGEFGAEVLRFSVVIPGEARFGSVAIYRISDSSDANAAEAATFLDRAEVEVWGWDKRQRCYRFTIAGGSRKRFGAVTAKQMMAALYHEGRSTDPGKAFGWRPP